MSLAVRWLREAHGIYVFSMRLPNDKWQPWYEHFTGDGKYKNIQATTRSTPTSKLSNQDYERLLN